MGNTRDDGACRAIRAQRDCEERVAEFVRLVTEIILRPRTKAPVRTIAPALRRKVVEQSAGVRRPRADCHRRAARPERYGDER
jgi:hypothetical protein